MKKRRLFDVRFFVGNRKIARELRSRVVRVCLSGESIWQRVPYDRRGIVGLFWHSWQCEPFPHWKLTNVDETRLAGNEEAISRNAMHS